MAKFTIQVDKDLSDIMPGFLNNRAKDIGTINANIQSGDFKSIEVIGHKLAGNAGGYGMAELGLIGKELENAAKNHQKSEVEQLFRRMKDYLSNVEIKYV